MITTTLSNPQRTVLTAVLSLLALAGRNSAGTGVEVTKSEAVGPVAARSHNTIPQRVAPTRIPSIPFPTEHLAQRSILPDFVSPIFAPVRLEWLDADNLPPNSNIVNSEMVSLVGLTPPSLWWTQQQVGGKLLKGWIAYPSMDNVPAYVDLVVNRQLWRLSDYLERYSFIHHFGQAAQDFGYVVRVFNDVGEYLAIYPCDRLFIDSDRPTETVETGGDSEAGTDLTTSPAIEAGDAEGASVEINDGPDALETTQQREITGNTEHNRRQSCPTILDSSGLGVPQDSSPFSNF